MLDSYWCVFTHFIHNLQGFFFCFLIATDSVIDQAKLQSLFSLDSSPSKDKLLGQRNTYCSCKSLGSSSSRNQAPISLRQAHFRVQCGDSDISIKCEFQSSSKGRTINEADYRTVDVTKIIEDPSQIVDNGLDLVFGFIEPFLQIRSSTKESWSSTLQDACPCFIIFVDLFYCVVKFIKKSHRKSIFFLRIVQFKFCYILVRRLVL